MNNHKNDVLNHEKILYLIKELEQNPQATQRDLSRKLGISLGKINFLLKALIEKGIIEAKNFKNAKNKLAYMYLFTPQGIKTKVHLTHQFFAWKTQEFEKLKNELEDFKKEIAHTTSDNLKDMEQDRWNTWSSPEKEVARSLGIHANVLYNWKKRYAVEGDKILQKKFPHRWWKAD